MHILITGGTGFIGHALANRLHQQGHPVTVLSRTPRGLHPQLRGGIRLVGSLDTCAPVDAVVNLAGENLGTARWTRTRKTQLRDSRIATTRALLAWLGQQAHKPRVLISGSAVGWYGDRGDEALDERSRAGDDFAAQLCRDWEASAAAAEALGIRLCILRIGVVLARPGAAGGGALEKMLPPFRLGAGGPVGSGQQWMSWIHRDDLVELMLFLLDTPKASGVFNGCAPSPVRNQELAQQLGRVLHRPSRLKVPALVLRTLLGEQAQIVLGSQRVLPVHASELGFRFRLPEIGPALEHCLS